MGRQFDQIDDELKLWISRQKIFFVATAPTEGHLNLSPRGMDVFRVLNDHECAWLDLTGSGIETIAHLKQNGRIVIMFCAFEASPRIVRLHGTGDAILPDHPEWNDLRSQFPDVPGERAIIRIRASRISDSCGYGVPLFQYVSDRTILVDGAIRKGPEGLADYRAQKNASSIDGLPGL